MSNIIAANDNSSLSDEVARIVALPYRRELVPEEDGSWFARVVELRGCMTVGDTKAEALENLEDAMREWVTAQLEDGAAIPAPTTATEYSGKFMVRVAPSLHRDLAENADREGVSMNSLVSNALAKSVGRTEAIGGGGPAKNEVPVERVYFGHDRRTSVRHEELVIDADRNRHLARGE